MRVDLRYGSRSGIIGLNSSFHFLKKQGENKEKEERLPETRDGKEKWVDCCHLILGEPGRARTRVWSK